MLGALCEPWPAVWCCERNVDVEGLDSDDVLMAASEILWYATGQRFGNCNVTLRPCRRSCDDLPLGLRWYDDLLYPSGGIDWPYPALIGGAWVNLACGICAGDCSCSAVSEVVLPDIADQIIEVEIDGETLPLGTGWVSYDSRTLVRTDGGQWPTCQDWTVTGGPGAWSIDVRFGEDVPKMGEMAVGVLACELLKACTGQDCDLPSNVVSVDRQGVSYQFADPQDVLQNGYTGLFLPDKFIDSVNPNHIMDRARVYSPDTFRGRLQS